MHAASPPPLIETVLHRYGRRIWALARRRLSRRLQSKIDADDVVQSVCRSFFRRADAGTIQVRDDKALWNLLALITVRKCVNRAAYYQAERRDVRREVPLSGDAAASMRVRLSEGAGFANVLMQETIEDIARALGEREAVMVRMFLQGYSVEQISLSVGRAERTVRRVLAHVRERLERVAE